MAHTPKPDPWDKWFLRLVAVFGLAGFVYETVWETNDRPYLLATILVMLGLVPAAVLFDRVLRKRNGG